jgi:hypothetical protein
MVVLIQPDKKLNTMIFPTLKSYAELPITENEVGGEVKTTELGEETIDGRACKKVKMTSTDANGKTQEATVWQAKDLKNFPIQMEMRDRSNTVLVKYQNPKLETPEASLFEIPAGYSKYDNFQALMQAALMKMFSGQGLK